jgi:hypothetical protein
VRSELQNARQALLDFKQRQRPEWQQQQQQHEPNCGWANQNSH